MITITTEMLEQMTKQHHTSDEANDFANQLIEEYEICDWLELSEFLGVNPSLKAQRAVRVWVQKNLPLIDSEETFGERYRQLRHLFQQKIPDFM